MKKIAKIHIAIRVIVESMFVPIKRFIMVFPVMERIRAINAEIPRQMRTVINKIE